MAYRLVTDVYPPSPHLEEPGSEVWREGGPGPRPARELNPQLSPELDALIARLLALAPEERFNGQTQLSAQRDASAKQELERREARQKAGVASALEPRRRSAFAPAWAAAGAAAFLVLVLVLVTVKGPRGEPQAAASMGVHKDRSISIGDNATNPPK